MVQRVIVRVLAGVFALVCMSGCARRYRTSGMVLQSEGDRLIVSHREIPGLMPAMAMPVRVTGRANSKAVLRPGDQIDFRLRPKSGTIDRVERRAAVAEGLTEGMRLTLPPETVAIGDAMPDFQLVSHDGQTCSLAGLRGNVVAVNFIYTRCPLPDVCPRLTSHFARLQRRFAGQPVRLLTITLDPQYDTAAVLKDYAGKWRADAKVWQLLTGEKAAIDGIAARFGMLYWPESGLLTHTSMTAVIDREGRLAARVEGSSYEAGQLGDLMENLLRGGSR